MKAYILSTETGTVQIGDTIFQPSTHKKFKADRKGLAGKPVVDVERKTFESARYALMEYPAMLRLATYQKSQKEVGEHIEKMKEEFERKMAE